MPNVWRVKSGVDSANVDAVRRYVEVNIRPSADINKSLLYEILVFSVELVPTSNGDTVIVGSLLVTSA